MELSYHTLHIASSESFHSRSTACRRYLGVQRLCTEAQPLAIASARLSTAHQDTLQVLYVFKDAPHGAL